MPKNKFLLPFLIFSSIIFAACNSSSTNRETPQPPVIPEFITPNTLPMEIQPTTEAAKQVIQANNQFALDLYQRYSSNPDNLFFSPYSMSTAIAMSYEGARGKTAKEIQKTFHFPEIETLQQGSAALNSQINQPNQAFQLSTANALWAEKTYPFAQEYLDNAKKYYQGEITNLDFINNANNSRIFINDWVAKKTNDKITNLIPEKSIDNLTRLVLTNAVYFKGDWIKQFDPEQTTEAEFQINSGDSTNVKMMRRTDEEATFNYAESDDMQIIELPYSGDQLSMLIILPKKSTDDTYNLNILEKNLTPDQLNNWKNALQMKRVFLYLPKFKLETTYQMAEDLIALGMVEAFSTEADFSGMTGFKDLNISAVIHKAFVEVNEEGTEAAAATAIVQRAGSAMPSEVVIPTFRADHPFIFIIQQKENGNILFIGRVSNPAE